MSNRKKNSGISEEPPLIPVADRRWLTLPEAASYLALSPNTVRHIIHAGELRAVRIGLMFRIDRTDLDQFMLRRSQVVAPYRRGTRPAVALRWAEYRAEKQTKQKRAAR
jgi:excisionase family DNA binding protein